MDKIDKFIYKHDFLRLFFQYTHIRDLREKFQENRVVYINHERSLDYYGPEPLKYANNKIKTSKLATPDPPVTPYTSIIPLAIVVVLTALKQAYEDVLRYITDREINNTRTRVIRNNQFVEVNWRDIKCGDIVEVGNDEIFPCDLILLWSNTENHTCHVTTANLDGETNLKQRKLQTGIPPIINPLQLSSIRGTIICDKPNTKLYEFSGKFVLNSVAYPTTNDNVLLRGSRLKIATLIYGVAIYTGKDTKVMLNSNFKPNKLSSIEKRLNWYIVIFLIILFALTSLCFGLSFIFDDIYSKHWYLAGREPKYYYDNKGLFNFITYIFFMSLINYIIPMSMYVTIELQRFIGTKFLEWDLQMYDEKTDQPAMANNSDLNEDLGQIEYLFCDKTGTLTENDMVFKQFSVDGAIYEERFNRLFRAGTNDAAQLNNEGVSKFIEALSLCHTVEVDFNAKERYQASSPDEFCFVKFCEKIGIIYLGERKVPNTQMAIRQVNVFNELKQYELLHVLEFQSSRKCMSVILKCLKTQQIIMFCKGAESVIFSKCVRGNIQQCNTDLNRFATAGWRTIVLAYRIITPTDYQNYDRMLLDAYNDINNREARLLQVFNAIESGLTLLGATGVEDRLQDECSITLEALRKAGIKIWVLTGDKRETAINISYSSKHFSKDLIELQITDINSADEIEHRLYMISQRIRNKAQSERFALIVDGTSLHVIMEYYSQSFLEICLECAAVLCCRMSPSQKAEVVSLVKRSKNKPMTAAVGDGANDVSMIQEANVGIGIFGKEGRNAARSADFAVARFKFLRRLILVQGYLYYTRAAYLVQYFFYKNLYFSIIQVYFAFVSAFSQQSVFNSLFLTFINIAFTSVPVFFYGLTEQKVRITKIEKNPFYYRSIADNRYLSGVQFIKWNLLAIWHSLVSFLFPYALFAVTSHFSADGTMSGLQEFGGIIITLVIIVTHLRLLVEWHYVTAVLFVTHIISVIAYVILCLVLNAFILPSPLTSIAEEQSLYWTFFDLLSHASVWWCIIAALIISVIPDFAIKVSENMYERNEINEYRKEERLRLMANNYPGYIQYIQYPKLPIIDQDKPRKYGKQRQNKASHKMKIISPNIHVISVSNESFTHSPPPPFVPPINNHLRNYGHPFLVTGYPYRTQRYPHQMNLMHPNRMNQGYSTQPMIQLPYRNAMSYPYQAPITNMRTFPAYLMHRRPPQTMNNPVQNRYPVNRRRPANSLV